MHYEGQIIRPPSEANSILLQVTVGCSHNKCTFCGAYKDERFRIKPEAVIMADIAFAAQYCRRQRRVFLCDGDALIVPQNRLLTILTAIREQLPWVTRVGTYANTKSIAMKSPEDLETLRSMGLGIAYLGLETGDDVTRAAIRKGSTAMEAVAMGRRLKAAGIKLSVTVLLGIAGAARSDIHARETGRALTAIDPEYVGALSLMLVAGTPMDDEHRAGRFSLPEPTAMLRELKTMIAHTDLTRGLFHATHASNFLPIRAALRRDKSATLELIDAALNGRIQLKPEYLRAL